MKFRPAFEYKILYDVVDGLTHVVLSWSLLINSSMSMLPEVGGAWVGTSWRLLDHNSGNNHVLPRQRWDYVDEALEDLKSFPESLKRKLQ